MTRWWDSYLPYLPSVSSLRFLHSSILSPSALFQEWIKMPHSAQEIFGMFLFLPLTSILTLNRTNKHIHLVGQLSVVCLLELSSTCKTILQHTCGRACRDIKMNDFFLLIFTLHMNIIRCIVNHTRHTGNMIAKHRSTDCTINSFHLPDDIKRD